MVVPNALFSTDIVKVMGSLHTNVLEFVDPVQLKEELIETVALNIR
jgi:hypothetical protein